MKLIITGFNDSWSFIPTGVTMDEVVLIAIASVVCEGIIAGTVVFNPQYTRPFIDFSVPDTGITTHLKPPPNESRCVSVCALTPGCMWASFSPDTGICNISDAICPRFVQNSRSQTNALLQNMVTEITIHICSYWTPQSEISVIFLNSK